MSLRRRCVVAAFATVLGSSCGGSTGAQHPAIGAIEQSAVVSPPPPSSGPGPDAEAGRAGQDLDGVASRLQGRGGDGAEERPTERRGDSSVEASADHVAHDADFPFEVEVTPRCVASGDTLSVRVTTRPEASAAAAIAYSDDQAHGSLVVGRVDGAGHWAWDVVVPAAAPTGHARVLISVEDRTWSQDQHGEYADTTGERGSARIPFEVSERCA